MIDLPPLVQQRLGALGEEGARWLADLPALLRRVAGEWDLTLGTPYRGGTSAVVVAARRADGVDCVVKAFVPEPFTADGYARSALTHGLAGDGCVGLLGRDDGSRVLLLERLGPNLHDLGFTVPQVLDAITGTLPRFWRPVPAGAAPPGDIALPTGADAAQRLADFIVRTWEQLGQPCERRVIDHALAYCDERAAAYDPATAVLVHGDAHGWNTLLAPDGTFRFVDPEGVRSERAHDLGIPLREYNEEFLAGDTVPLVRARAARLAAACDADPEAVWQWGFVERVSTGLANLRDFDTGDGPAMLEVARRCARG